MGKRKEERKRKKSNTASKYKRGLRKLSEKLASLISSSDYSSSEESTASSNSRSEAVRYAQKGNISPLFVDADPLELEERNNESGNMLVEDEGSGVDNGEKGIVNPLGADPSALKKEGPDVHQDIATRWNNFLKKGIDKAERKELMDKYPVVKNVQALKAPILNPELKVCLGEFYIKQDTFLSKLQDELGSAISAIAEPMHDMYSAPTNQNNQYLIHLSNATRLLSDIHYGMSLHRRYFNANKIDPTIKKAIMEAPIDEHLFGENLITRIKQNQEIKKASEDLKPKKMASARPTTSRGQIKQNTYLNFKRQASKTRYKKEERGRAVGSKVHQQRRDIRRH